MNLQYKYSLEEIIKGCREGKSRFQELLYKLMASKMLGVCMRYAKDQFEAEDIMQSGFVKVFRKIDMYKGEGAFEGWVRKIMVNTSIEFYRRNVRSLNIVDISEINDQEISISFDMNSLHVKDLMKIIQGLSPGYRMVFNMYAIEGFSHKEIAAELGITEGASKSQLSRARAILREQVLKMEEQVYETNVG